MTLNLRVEHADGTTDTITASTARITEDLDEQDRAQVTVLRKDWTPIADSITPRKAKLYIEKDNTDKFGGRLDTTDTRSDVVTIRINSPEIDAREAEPTGANVIYENVGDDTIVTDQVNAVSTLTAGTITQQAPSVSYTVSYGSRSKVLYDLRAMTGSEFSYNSDWTLDYVDRLGSDESANVTLSPSNQNLGDDFNLTRDVRENVTHIKALGAQQGPDQISTTATASSYSSGRKIWKRYENKEVVEQARLQSIADTLVNEYDGEPRYVTVECSVFPENTSVDLVLGDTVHVDYPEESIDRDLRIIRLEEEWGQNGHVYNLTLSNRQLARDMPETKRKNDIQRFNSGWQGFLDRNQTTSGWNVAGDTIPQKLEIPSWPDDIITEKQVELTVLGRAWRSPVSSADHSHGVTVTHPSHSHTVSVAHPSHDHSVTVTHPSHSHSVSVNHPQHSHSVTVTHPSHTHDVTHPSHSHSYDYDTLDHKHIPNDETRLTSDGAEFEYPFGTENIDGFDFDVCGQVLDQTAGSTSSTTTAELGTTETSTTALGTNTSETSSAELGTSTSETSSAELGTDTIETSDAALGTTTSETSSAELGTNTTETSDTAAGFDASITETFNGNSYYPTDVEIRVNGTLITTIAGDGTQDWQSTVDLTGQLVSGANTITATPTTERGSLNLIITSELFRKGAEVT